MKKATLLDAVKCFGWFAVLVIFVTTCASIMAVFADALGFYAFAHNNYPGDLVAMIHRALPGKKLLFIYIYPVIALPFLFYIRKKCI